MNQPSRGRGFIAFILSICLCMPSLLEARVQPSHGFDMFSASEEVKAGQQAAQEVQKQLPMLPDSSPVVKYVQSLGAQLAAHAPGEKWPYSFHVVNQKEINAFALPGGPVFVHLGTIQAADNEAELAGVLAHEISHVVQRHGTRAASKQMAAQLPLAVLGGMLGRGALAQTATMGYDPRQMASFFRKLQSGTHASSAAEFFSDHPDPGNRFEYVSAEVGTLRAKPYRGNSAEFAQVKQAVGGMKPFTAQEIAQQQKEHRVGEGPSGEPEVGTAARPSANLKELDHNQFRISYPENWKVYGDQNSAVTIAPPDGISENAISYGAMISVYQPEKTGAGLDANTHELVASLKQSNPGLREIGRDEEIRVNGVAGRSEDLVGVSPVRDAQGSAVSERDWLVTLPRKDGSLLYVVFISPDPDFSQLRTTFEQMLRSLRVK
jgi:beta-barrel assembly-enhancing protease